MDKKLISKVISTNITFSILTVIATVNFMMHIYQTLWVPQGAVAHSVLSINYTLFKLTINVSHGELLKVYTVDNYPLIPIAFALAFNIYYAVKVHRIKDNS